MIRLKYLWWLALAIVLLMPALFTATASASGYNQSHQYPGGGWHILPQEPPHMMQTMRDTTQAMRNMTQAMRANTQAMNNMTQAMRANTQSMQMMRNMMQRMHKMMQTMYMMIQRMHPH